jgi:hypothetical protein
VGEKLVEVAHGPHDLDELFGKPDFLVGPIGGEHWPNGRVFVEQLLIEAASHGREVTDPLEGGLHQPNPFGRYGVLSNAPDRSARPAMPSLV